GEWSKNDLKPHITKIFKLSSDPDFEAKFWDVVGLYLDPPDKALVLCCDEKSQCQALARTQLALPLAPKRPRTMTHDYTATARSRCLPPSTFSKASSSHAPRRAILTSSGGVS